MSVEGLRSFQELEKVAKVTRNNVSGMIIRGVLKGKQKPLAVEPAFYESLKEQTEQFKTKEHSGIERLLFLEETVDFIQKSTRVDWSWRELKEILNNGYEVDQTITESYIYWRYNDGKLLANDDGIFKYEWKGKKVGSPIVTKDRIEELITIIKDYPEAFKEAEPVKPVVLKRHDVDRADYVKTLGFERKGTEKEETNTNPIVFYMKKVAVYMEQSKGIPKGPTDSGQDGSLIKFMREGLCEYSSRGFGDKYWIARFPVNDTYYNIVFFTVNMVAESAFLTYFSSIPVFRDYKGHGAPSIRKTAEEFKSKRASKTHTTEPLWFRGLVKVYLTKRPSS